MSSSSATGNVFPIVGMFFRPPAQAIVNALAIGVPLTLVAEPDNPADPNAIGVWVYSKDIPEAAHEKLGESAEQFGFSLDQILAQDAWQLGYIPRQLAKALRDNNTVPSDKGINGSFSCSPSGAPRVRLEDFIT